MSYKVVPVERFKTEAKRLIKKYPSLAGELSELALLLASNPKTGTSLGNDCYKIRLSIKSKSKGRSGGARVISYLVTEQREVYLLTIYDKADFASIDSKTIQKIIENIRRVS